MPDGSAVLANGSVFAQGLAALATSAAHKAAPGVGSIPAQLLLSRQREYGGGRMARPLGITILAILVGLAALITFLIGLAGVFVGLAGLLPGSPIPAGALISGGVLYLLISIILGIASAGLLRLRPWAWWLAFLTTLASLVYVAYGTYSNASAPGGSVSLTSALTLAFVLVVLLYLVSVYRAFRRPAVPM